MAINTQPKSVTVAAGETAKFSVAASGVDLSYLWQWRKSSSGTWAASDATGHNTRILQIAATQSRNGYQYRCVVMDGEGNALTSSAATLTVS